MKIRLGMVSNSSSSSFIIGCKDKPTKTKLLKAFKVSKDSVFYDLAEGMSDCMVEVKEIGPEDRECYDEELMTKIADKGFKTYVGYAANDNGSVEECLCDISLDYEDDDIIIYKEGGY